MQRFATHLDPQWVRRIARSSPPPWGPLGYFTFKRTYARFIPALGRTEQLHETLERCINALLLYGARLTEEDAQRLFMLGYQLKALPGGRMLWQLGTPTVDRLGGASLFNCYWNETRAYEDFCWTFDMSMLGGGVGFAADGSRLPDVVAKTPCISWVPDGGGDAWQVPDTREGWVELLRRTYRSFFDTGEDFCYGTRLVRPAGAPILGFGGTASGPGPLIEGVEKVNTLLSSCRGRHLSSVDVVDIHTIQGEIVKSGNVRRTALIGVGRHDDTAYLHAKRWDLGYVPGPRGYVNLTVEAEDADELPPDYWYGFEHPGEQFGLFNRRLIQREDSRATYKATGVNPCAEIALAHHEPCCLTEIFTPRIESLDEFVEAARLMHVVSKTCLSLPFHDAETEKVVRANQRMGIGATGVRGSRWTDDEFQAVYGVTVRHDREYSRDARVSESCSFTTCKPSGTLSLLPGVQPGVHGDVSEYYLRRIRVAAEHPLVQAARDHGYYTEVALDHNQKPDERTQIVSFPVSGGVKAGDAIEQLEFHARMQKHWSDNCVSVTVTFRDEEVPAIKAWLKENFRDRVKTVSFMRDMGHGFTQTPYEPISRDLYRMLSHGLRPMLDVHVERDDYLDADSATTECAGGSCPLK